MLYCQENQCSLANTWDLIYGKEVHCDISDNSKDLCIDQHANAFSETLTQTVAEGTGSVHGPVAMTGGIIGTGIKTGIDLLTDIGQKTSAGRIKDTVKLKTAKGQVLSGRALKDWIIDKGFNGRTTQSQRNTPKGLKGSSVNKEVIVSEEALH